jgi:hypothetical protein
MCPTRTKYLVTARWDGAAEDLPGGYDATMVRAVEGHQAGIEATTLSYMTVAVVKDMTRRGLARTVLTALRGRATDARLSHVMAPVRPTLKPRYPLTAMERYATWTGPDGLVHRSLDPHPPAHGSNGSRCRPAVDGGHRDDRRLGVLDRHGVPGDRPVRRTRCSWSGRHRPCPGHRHLHRGESLGSASLTLAARLRTTPVSALSRRATATATAHCRSRHCRSRHCRSRRVGPPHLLLRERQ